MLASPFDSKNKIASALDRLALRLLLFLLSVSYFFFLWENGTASLVAGSALFVLLLLGMLLIERRTLSHRDRLLRERVGGMIAIEELILSPAGEAGERVCRLLCDSLGACHKERALMLYEGECYLVRCAQCLQGASVSEGDVLSAHRARLEAGADKCALASTAGFSPAAIRAAEWVDPPIRLITGRQLALLFGRRHPATDEDIARHLSRQKKPFSFERIRALALAPAKLRRHLLCAFLLLMLYLLFGSPVTLLACLLSFLLAILCDRENKRSFSL